MAIAQLGVQLQPINNNGGYNPNAACQAISIRTAQILHSGANPAPPLNLVAVVPVENAVATFDDDAAGVWTWFQQAAHVGKVYRAESEDHAWNFVKDYYARVYIVDVSCWNFKRVMAVGDFGDTIRNGPNDVPAQVAFNYAGPGDEISINDWGTLAIRWSHYLHDG